MLLVSLVGAGIYFTAQAWLGAPQVQWVTAALRAEAVGEPSSGRRWHRPRSGLDHAGDRVPSVRRWRLDVALLLGPLTVGALAGVKIKYAVLAVVAIGIVGWVMARPAVAAYLLIFLTPLIVGFNDAVVFTRYGLTRPSWACSAWPSPCGG